MAITAASLAVTVKANTSAAEGALGRMSGLLRGGLVAAAAAGVVAVAGMGIASVKMAGDFQESMTQLVTGAGESRDNLGLVSAGILKMAVDTATPVQQLSSGMYSIESAGFRGAAGLAVLKAAAEGAKSGASDLQTSSVALTTVMKDYPNVLGGATGAMNTLIATVQQSGGKTHLQELGQALSSVLPSASMAHVGLNDVMGAMATMTSEGVPAANAATYLRQTILNLEAPSSAGAKALASVGLSAQQVQDDIKTKGLPAALQDITDAVGKKFPVGSAAYLNAIKQISGGTKSIQGILDLTGTHAKDFANSVKDIADKTKNAGHSIIGWGDVQQNFNFKMGKAKEVVETFLIKLGTGLLPIVGKLVDAFTTNVLPVLSQFADFVSANIGPALDGIGGIIGSTIVPMLRGFGSILTGTLIPALKKAWEAIEPTLIPALHGLGGFITGTVVPAAKQFATFFATQLLPVLTQLAVFIVTNVIPAAEKLGTFIAKNVIPIFEQVAAIIVKDVVPVLESIFTTIMTQVVPSLEKIWNIVAPKLIPVLQFLGGIFKNVIGPAISFVIGIIGKFIGTIADVITWVGNILGKLGNFKDFITGAFGTAINGITGVFKGVFNGLWDIVKAPLNLIIGGINLLIQGMDHIHFNVPGWVPGVGGKGFGIDIPTIPLLAQGGDITQSGYVVVGDAGPELLKLPTGAQVAPLTHPAPLPAGMQQTYGTATATANGQPIQFNLYFDGKKLAQLVTQLQPGIIRNGTGARAF